MKTVFIYALKDPRDGAVRYIGKAKDPRYRFRAHLGSEPGTHKAHWIRQLKDLELIPSMEILDEVPESQWEFFERAYIKVYRESGAALTNITDGGDGGATTTGKKWSLERRMAAKGRKHPPRSPEWCAAISAAKIGRPGHSHTLETREAMSVIMSGRKYPPRSPEVCANMSRAMKGVPKSPESIAARTGKSRGPYKNKVEAPNV